MLNCTQALKEAALSMQGNIPVVQIEIYDIIGHTSAAKGLEMKIYSDSLVTQRSGKTRTTEIKEFFDAMEDDVVFPTSGKAYCPIAAFNWGDSPPLGVTGGMLEDEKAWSMMLRGYFHAKKPGSRSISYQFGIMSTSYSAIIVSAYGSQPWAYNAISPEKIAESRTFEVAEDTWLPISIYYQGAGISGINKHRDEEKLIVYWRDSIDNEWRILGADMCCPLGGRFSNMIGNAVVSVDSSSQPASNDRHLLSFAIDGAYYYMYLDNDTTNPIMVAPGQKIYDLSLRDSEATRIDLTLNDTINHGDLTEIWTVRGDEEPYILKSANDIQLQMDRSSASVLDFTVPITTEEYNVGSKSIYNSTTYDIETNSFGVLRKNAKVTASFGYQVQNKGELVRRFTGIIRDIEPKHGVANDGTPTIELRVTCMDARVRATSPPSSKIGEMVVGNLPNKFTYNLVGMIFGNEEDSGPDTIIMPPAYDKWNLVDVIRSVGYLNNFHAEQLYARDSNGNYLIEDRGIYLDYTLAYPYQMVSTLGGRVDMGTINVPTTNPEVYHKGETEGVKSEIDQQTLWKTAAEVKDMPYINTLDLGQDAWSWVQGICQGYGMDLFVDADGYVRLQAPTRDVIYSTENAGIHADEYIAMTAGIYSWERVEDGNALGNCIYVSSNKGAGAMITVVGTGVRLILARSQTPGRIYAEVDEIVVDGINALDSVTGDKGHIEWIRQLDENENSVSVGLPFNIGRDRWYYKDGHHPQTQDNPSMITICENLTYGEHKIYIEVLSGDVAIEGFVSVKQNLSSPIHTFDITHISDLGFTDSVDSILNDVVVIGNPMGVAGEFIQARAVDVGGIYGSSPTYIGEQRTGVIIDPKIVNKDRAMYLAKYVLTNLYKGVRKLKVEAVSGLPWLSPGDPVSVRDMHLRYKYDAESGEYLPDEHPVLGLMTPSDITKAEMDALAYSSSVAPYGNWWIESMAESFSAGIDGDVSYTLSCMLTDQPPKPAYIPIAEPEYEAGDPAISNVLITIDGNLDSYNPYKEHHDSEYVNISFNLNWNAMTLAVRVCPAVDIDLPTGETLRTGQTAGTLLARQSLTPAGKYEIKWDGWVEAGGKGCYAPNGTYYFEFETTRYNPRETFNLRTDNHILGVMSDASKETIIIQHNRSIYDSPLFSADVTPAIGASVYYNPPIIYDDTNGGLGLKFDVTLNLPAKVVMTLWVRQLVYTGSLPDNESEKEFKGDTFSIELQPDDGPLLEPGTYTTYFRPKSMTLKNNALQSFYSMPRAFKNQDSKPVWVAWNYKLTRHIYIVDKGGKSGYASGNTIYYAGYNYRTVAGHYAGPAWIQVPRWQIDGKGIETGYVLRRRTSNDSYKWLAGIVTGISYSYDPAYQLDIATITCADGFKIMEDTLPELDRWWESGETLWFTMRHDDWEVGGVPVGGDAGALAFPYGYEFCWGGPTAGLYATAMRRDCNRYYHFFRIIG